MSLRSLVPILAAFDYSGQSSAGLLVSCFLSFSLLFGPAGSGQDSFRSYFFIYFFSPLIVRQNCRSTFQILSKSVFNDIQVFSQCSLDSLNMCHHPAFVRLLTKKFPCSNHEVHGISRVSTKFREFSKMFSHNQSSTSVALSTALASSSQLGSRRVWDYPR